MAAVSVTVDQCKNWEKSGKSDFIRTCKSCVAGSSDVVESISTVDLKRVLYDLCSHVVAGSLKGEQALIGLTEVVDMHKDVPSLLADVFSIIDMETQDDRSQREKSSYDEKTARERYTALVTACSLLTPDALLKERLELDTLENLGVIESKSNFQGKYVKVKTKLYYKQQKFNLLREESEGYSKLVADLGQEFGADLANLKLLENVRSLIGGFNLDPNRVLDIILESFECRPHLGSFFVPLLKSYINDADTLCQVLGFKFQFYQQTQDSETPTTLYKVAALLLKNGLIDMTTIYSHLSPSDGDIKEQHDKAVQEAKEYARKLSIVVLSDKANDKDKDKEDAKLDLCTNNQKLGLVEALLEIGDWGHAQQIMDRMPPSFPASHQPVAHAICRLVHYTMEPLYKQHSGLPEAIMKKRAQMKMGEGPQATTFSELCTITFPVVRYLGPYLSCDPVLVGKLLRLSRAFMAKRGESPEVAAQMEEVMRGFLTVVDEVLLPSLSLLPNNCCLAEDLWSFLKLLRYEYRYRLYGQWKNESYVVHPILVRTRADCIEKTKYIMKRLAKENVKPLGRQIGKLSHSNPTILFDIILSQIQRYDNFIGPVVDSLKYLSSLSYDVLAYCIIEALANPEKDRMKHDDTNISLWLQSLASFSGSVFKKYPIELAGLLQYVLNTLKAGKSFDLLILREVAQKMAGIEISEEITDDQLDAMSGGDLLKVEGGYFAQVRNTKKSSQRLKEVLLEHNLAIPLCLMMAQQRNAIVFSSAGTDDQRPLKLIGKLYDQCHDTFVQFASFLSMQLSVEEFTQALPKIDHLLSLYHLTPEAAFSLCRTIYSNAINARFEELRKTDKKEKSSTSKSVRYIESVESVMGPVVDLIQDVLPVKTWDDLGPHFYSTFWSLSMYDVQVPSAAYEKQAQHLRAQLTVIDDNKDMPSNKKKKERERTHALIDKLAEEEKKQTEHVNRVMARLKHDRENWFLSRSTKNHSVTAFLQYCIFPRCCFTAIDAVFCAKFIHILHNLKTPNFSSLICYDRIFSDITFSVTCCTENEAHRYGRFFSTALDCIMRWHSDKSIYEKECAQYPGFVTVFRSKVSVPSQQNKADQLDYENYRHVCHKWHFSMTRSMVACLESGNYIQIRNAIIVLTKILNHYPRVQKLGQALERRVDRICQEEKERRPDLYALAMGYAGQLKSRKKTWVSEQDFHQKEKEGAKSAAAKTNGPASGSTGKPESVTSNSTSQGTSASRSSKERAKESKEGKENKEGKSKSEAKEANRTPNRGVNDRVTSAEARTAENRSVNDVGYEKHKDGEKVSKKKEKHSDSKEKELQAKREKKEEKLRKEKEKEKQLAEDGHAWEETRSHSKEKERRDKEGAIISSSSSHRRSAEPSPKHVEERDIKRRKIEIASSSKESVHSHRVADDASPKLQKSPGHERGEESRTERKERLDRERQEYRAEKLQKERRADMERERAQHEREREERERHDRERLEREWQEQERQERDREREKEWARGREKVDRKRTTGERVEEFDPPADSKRYRAEEPSSSRSGSKLNGDSDRDKSRDRAEKVRSPKKERLVDRGGEEIEEASNVVTRRTRKISPEVKEVKVKKSEKRSKKSSK